MSHVTATRVRERYPRYMAPPVSGVGAGTGTMIIIDVQHQMVPTKVYTFNPCSYPHYRNKIPNRIECILSQSTSMRGFNPV